MLNHTKDVWSVMLPVDWMMIFTSPLSSNGSLGSNTATWRLWSTTISTECTSSAVVSVKVRWAMSSVLVMSVTDSKTF